jgi:hypothetical protein
MGSVISVFDDFMASTESAYLTKPNEVINEVVQNAYALGYMLKSGDQSITLQSGKSIKWFAQMSDVATAHFYLPDDVETPTQPQSITTFEIGWRFLRDNVAWNKETVALNLAAMDPNGRRTQIIDMKRQYEQAMWTSKINKMESALFATPGQADMETASTAKVPYSLGVWNNELTNTIPYISAGSSTQWSTIAGKDPATISRFRNQTAPYNGGSVGAVAGSTAPHLFTAMRRVLNKTGFDKLPEKPEYSQKKSIPTRILCSLDYGIPQYEYALQTNNDFLRYAGGQDPAYPNPTFQGIPLEGISALNTAIMYPTAASAFYSTENDTAGATNAGPRYHFLNFEYFKPVFHTEMYMYRHPVMTHPNQPSTHVMYVDTYYNIVCTSRQRQGIVYPATADSAFI